METASKPDTQRCSVCSIYANLICKACKGTPDGVGGLVAVYYCGATCQKAGWQEHKPSCRAAKDRRVLYCAGDIARYLCQVIHKNTWMWPIEKMERNGDEWLIFDGEYIGRSVVLPFPSTMFPNAKDQEAILSHSCCNAAVAHLHNPIKEMLKDIYSEVDEVIVRVKNRQLKIKRPLGIKVEVGRKIFDLRTPLHNVLRVTLTNGEVYALDLTGPQFGWHGPTVLPWSVFFETRVDIVKEVHNFGETARIIKEEAEAAGVGRVNMHHINDQIVIHLNHYLKQWQKDNGSLKAMLRWSEEDFKPKQDSLLRFMEDRMLEVRSHAMKMGVFDIMRGKPPKR